MPNVTSLKLARVVIDRPGELAARCAALVADGWSLRPGFDLPDDPWDLLDRGWLCGGEVADDSAAAAAALAGARGTGLVVACADAELRGALVADLRRLGPCQVDEAGPHPLDRLDPEQRAIIDGLAQGETLPDIAAAAFLSLRTAERRLATARATLGVRTTAEAVALAGQRHPPDWRASGK